MKKWTVGPLALLRLTCIIRLHTASNDHASVRATLHCHRHRSNCKFKHVISVLLSSLAVSHGAILGCDERAAVPHWDDRHLIETVLCTIEQSDRHFLYTFTSMAYCAQPPAGPYPLNPHLRSPNEAGTAHGLTTVSIRQFRAPLANN
ncbi:hypothetical protein AB1N83_006599 [Pleurotus pulmonarius]